MLLNTELLYRLISYRTPSVIDYLPYSQICCCVIPCLCDCAACCALCCCACCAAAVIDEVSRGREIKDQKSEIKDQVLWLIFNVAC